MKKSSPIQRQLPLVLIGSIAVLLSAPAAHATNLYWDTNTSGTAGAGAILGTGTISIAGTWGVNDYWTTGADGISGTYGSATAADDTLYFVADPKNTGVITTGTVTVSGTQSANGIVIQASNNNGNFTFSGGQINLGAGGLSVPTNAYESTANTGRVYLYSMVNLTTDQTWSYNATAATNRGIYIENGLTGSGNLAYVSTNNGTGLFFDNAVTGSYSGWTGSLSVDGGGVTFRNSKLLATALNSSTLTLKNSYTSTTLSFTGLDSGATTRFSNAILLAGTSNQALNINYWNGGARGNVVDFAGPIMGTTGSATMIFGNATADISGTGQFGTIRLSGDNSNWTPNLTSTAVSIRYGYLFLDSQNALGANNSLSVLLGNINGVNYLAGGLYASNGITVNSAITVTTNGNGSGKGGEVFLGLDGTGSATFAGKIALNNSSSAAQANNVHLRALAGGTAKFTGGFSDNTSAAANSAIIVDGGGTVVLSATSNYYGKTYVNAGTLKLDFANAAAASNLINASATKSNSALVVGGGTLEVAGKDSIANSQLFYGTNINTGNSKIQASNGAGGSVALNLGALTRNLGGVVDFVLPTGSISTTNGISTTTTSVSSNVLVSAASNGIAYATVGGSDWASLSGSNVVALPSYNPNSFTAADNTDIIADEAAASDFTVNTLRFNDATAHTVSLSGVNTVSTGGILVTSTAANGGTISGGTLRAGGGNELVVINNSKLTVNSTIADSASGASALTLSGSGVTTLGGANTYSGATTVNGGTLSISSTAALGTASSAITLGDNAHKGTLSYTGNSDTFTRGINVIAGGSELDVTTAGQTLTLTGTVAAATTTVTANTAGAPATYGDFTVGGDGNVTILKPMNLSFGGFVKNGSGTVTLGENFVGLGSAANKSNTYTLTSATNVQVGQCVSGAGIPLGTTVTAVNGLTITLSASSTAVVTNAVFGTTNVYSGDTIINSGTLKLASYMGLSGPSIVRVNEGTLDLGGFATAVTNVSAYLNGGVIQNGTYNLGNGTLFATSGTLAAIISGGGGSINGSLVKSGTGTLLVTSANNHGGLTDIREGTLRYGVSNVIGSGAVQVSGGTLDMGSFSDTVGAVTMSSGTIASTTGQLTGASYTFTDSGTVSARLGGNVALIKSGTGTVTLSGSNTMTGSTTVNGGKLAVNGFHTGSPITVNSGGTLAGSGTVGAVTVNSGAHFAPGNSITTTFKTGALTLNAGSSTDVELGTASASRTLANSSLTNDKTTVGGALTLGGTLNLIDNANAGGLGQAGAGSYLIFTGASSVTGAFGSVAGITGYHAAVNTTATPGNVYVDLNYYAKAGFSAVSGGTIDEIDATHFTLSLGSADANTGIATASITLDNVLRDAVYQDLLGGAFNTDGKGSFSLSGFDGTLSAIQSGNNVTLTVSFDTAGATAGTYTGSVVFTPTSTNAAGAETLNAINLGLTFEVTQVPEPATWSMIVGGLGVMAFVQRARRRMSR